MRILALETSAKAVSAAVTEDGKVLCSGYQDTGLTHSRTLMPIVEAMLKNTGLTVQDCDAVAVAAGPGSFTGIRIGVSAAKDWPLPRTSPARPSPPWRPWPGTWPTWTPWWSAPWTPGVARSTTPSSPPNMAA